jgi:hypothetical protein
VVDVEHPLDGNRRLLPLLLLVAGLLLGLPRRLLLRRRRPRLLFGRGLAIRRGNRGLPLGRRLLLLRREAVLIRVVLAAVVLHIDDAALSIERWLDVLLPVLPAALSAPPAPAAPLPAEPAPPAATLALWILSLHLWSRGRAVRAGLRVTCVARLGCISGLDGLRRCGGTVSFSVHS